MKHGTETEELTARVLLPPLVVRLLPSVALERLEEYHSDENIVYLLIGVFAGGVLGIISNWATGVPLVVSHSSFILLLVYLFLTMVFAFWARRIRQRVEDVRNQILKQDGDLDEPD